MMKKSDRMKKLMESMGDEGGNRHTGSSFDDFLKEEKIELEVTQSTHKKTQDLVRKRIRLKTIE